MMKQTKRILSVVLCLVMMFCVVPKIEVEAICCRKDYFDKSKYTLTGDMAYDVAMIAKSQKGRTCSDFGYGGDDYGAWCDEFVADCLENAGADNSIVAHGGGVADFKKKMEERGATAVGLPQMGDLVFFTNGSRLTHVEIVTKVEKGVPYCAGGNNGDYPGLCRGERKISSTGLTVSSYLRPQYTKPVAYNPVGSLDSCSGENGEFHVSGWAFDKDDINAALTIHVYVGGPAPQGEGAHVIIANTTRNDVDEAYHVGTNHGYNATIQTSLTGEQTVYVYAINVGDGNNMLIGSKTINITPNVQPTAYDPVGMLDSCSGGVEEVNVSGWAFDKDDINAQLTIHVYIGGPAPQGEGAHIITANTERSDVDDVHHVGPNHGYNATIQTDLTGEQTVYVYAINVGDGNNMLIGSRTIYIESAYDPVGVLDSCSGGEGKVKVSGWAFDKDDLNATLPIHVYIGGPAQQGDTPYVTVANTTRNDVDEAYHIGKNHGFDATIQTDLTGEQPIYVYAINIGSGEDSLIGIKTVTISSHTHSYIASVTHTPTCSVPGEKTFTCSCGDSYTETIPVDASNHVNTTAIDAIVSTCMVKGYTAGVYCNDCKKYISGHVEQPLANHTTTIINQQDATYDTTGYTGDEYCTVCKQTIQTGTVIPKLEKPVDPTPSDPQPNPNACKYCGRVHTGLFGWLISFFHNILAIFKR